MTVLTTDRLILRPLTDADVTDAYVGWLNDPEVNRFLETRHAPQTLESVAAFMAAVNARDDEHLFGVFLREDGRHVGNIKVGPIRALHDVADISLFLGDRSIWGRGVAAEAIAALSAHAFNGLGVRKLSASMYAANAASERAFLRAGWSREGLRRAHLDLDGERSDVIELGSAPALPIGESPMRDALLRQLQTAWALATYHLDGLTTEACLWRPTPVGPHVHPGSDGRWIADWPDGEGYDSGPPSIAWTTWHMGFWWSMALDHAFGDGAVTRDAIPWPGDAESVRISLQDLHDRWRSEVETLSDEELRGMERTRWPFGGRPFADVVAWANVELTKNAAEIGYARFLYAAAASSG